MARVEDFTAFRLLKHTEKALLTIRRSSGNNTDPYVTLDYNDAVSAESTKKHVLFLDAVDHPVDETLVGPNYRPVLSLEVTGISNIDDDEIPRMMSMGLEQDVRTVLAACVATVRNEISKGCIFRFVDCKLDGGELAPNKQAGFSLVITWEYPQGSTW